MIAASLRDAEGDPIIDLLLRKDADVNVKSVSGQVRLHQFFTWITPFLFLSLPSNSPPERAPLCNLQNQHLDRPHLNRPQVQRQSKRQARSTRPPPRRSRRLRPHHEDPPRGR